MDHYIHAQKVKTKVIHVYIKVSTSAGKVFRAIGFMGTWKIQTDQGHLAVPSLCFVVPQTDTIVLWQYYGQKKIMIKNKEN